MVLPGLVRCQGRSFGVDPEPTPMEIRGQTPRAITKVRVGKALFTPDNRLAIGNGRRDGFLYEAQVELLCAHREHLPFSDRGVPASPAPTALAACYRSK